jgi:CIC family chloride channel protein
VEDLCDRVWRGPEWARPAAGGLLLGALLLVLPEMYGVGYPVLENAVGGRYTIAFLLVLLLGKMAATSLTIGIGGSGGVFAPSLFMGAVLGAAYGAAAGHLFPTVAGPVGAYGLIGMGAVFAGAARAPITAVVIMFELTGEYTIILPLMAAIVLATLAGRALSTDTIYTLKLRRRGIDLDQAPGEMRLAGRTVGTVMEPPPEPLAAATPLAEAALALARAPHGILPVAAADGAYLGTATARSAAETLADGAHDGADVAAIVHLPVPLTADTDLGTALDALVTADGAGLPVLDPAHRHPTGWITHQGILRALHATAASVPASGARPSPPPSPAHDRKAAPTP